MSALFLLFFVPTGLCATVGPTLDPENTAAYTEEEIASLNAAAEKRVEEAKTQTGSSRDQAFGKSVASQDVFEAPPQQKASSGKSLMEIGEEYGFKPETAPKGQAPKKRGTQMGLVRMWGSYRLAAGDNGDDFIVNDANSVNAIMTLQGPQSDYVFGSRQINTQDSAIYNQYKLNVDFTPAKKWDFYTQIVIDPWSWVGTTGEQTTRGDGSTSAELRYNLKYFGAFNSTIRETYRDNEAKIESFDYIKVHDGHLTGGSQARVTASSPGGIPDRRYTIPELDVDTELRPFRKMWLDYKEDDWNVRAFALADEEQALSTDDPLELSNHRDYWQQSPWLYQYKPVQYFNDGSIKRGYYSDALSYYARDSEGNRLVLLRGASYKGEFDKTSIETTVAAPYTPWDEKYGAADNIVGAVRIKHEMSENWMVGTTYTFREGLIDNSVADDNKVLAFDTKVAAGENVYFLGEVAQSHRALDLKTDEATRTSTDGRAYKAEFVGDYDHKNDDGHTFWRASYTQMDRRFEPKNSIYLNTRDDRFWGTHLSFDDHPDLAPFKLGDGVDVNRRVGRFHWEEKFFKDRFYNEFDIRNVHKVENTQYFDDSPTGTANDHYAPMDTSYVETVTRDEVTLKLNPRVTAKGLFRWRALPKTTKTVDPTFYGYYFPKEDIDLYNFYVYNDAIEQGKNADQFTYSGALQYVVDPRLTLEGVYERTNAIPDFPRGLLNDFSRPTNSIQRVDGILEDRVQNFMYLQGGNTIGGKAPYRYYNIFRERLIYRPESRVTYTVHAAQNGYEVAGGIDENINHVGLGVEFVQTKKMTWFMDYTFSRQIDLSNYVATNGAVSDFNGHHNFYASLDYKLNAKTSLRGEYGCFGLGTGKVGNPYNVGSLALPTVDTEHLFRISLTGEF